LSVGVNCQVVPPRLIHDLIALIRCHIDDKYHIKLTTCCIAAGFDIASSYPPLEDSEVPCVSKRKKR